MDILGHCCVETEEGKNASKSMRFHAKGKAIFVGYCKSL